MEPIFFNFFDGRLGLNKKSFKRKDRATLAVKYEKYSIEPLLQAIEEREKSLFKNELRRLESYRKMIAETMNKLDTMRAAYVSQHAYVTSKEKVLTKSEMLQAMTYAENIYDTYNEVGDELVDFLRKIATHVEKAELSQDWEEAKEYLNSLDDNLFIVQDKRPFYKSMTDGRLPAIKSSLLKYYQKKRGREDTILGLLKGFLVLLFLPFGGIISLIIGIFWQLDKYSEKETSDKFDEALAEAISDFRSEYLADVYKTVNDNVMEMTRYGTELAHKGGNYFAEALNFMPEEYRNLEDCQNLHRILGEGYAENIREAYMVYENEKMRQELNESERQRKEQTLAMLNVVAASVATATSAANAAYSASEMAISAQEKLIDARRETENANKRIAEAEKKNAENKAALEKIKRDIKDN